MQINFAKSTVQIPAVRREVRSVGKNKFKYTGNITHNLWTIWLSGHMVSEGAGIDPLGLSDR